MLRLSVVRTGLALLALSVLAANRPGPLPSAMATSLQVAKRGTGGVGDPYFPNYGDGG